MKDKVQKWINFRNAEYNNLLDIARSNLAELEAERSEAIKENDEKAKESLYRQICVINAQISLYKRFLNDVETLALKIERE